MNEQPKLVDPGVLAESPRDAWPEEELDGSQEVKEKPSYVMRDVAARWRAGLDVESEPRQSRGVEVRADNVIVMDDMVMKCKLKHQTQKPRPCRSR